MKRYLKTDEWNIIEDNFHADNLRMSESIFSLGNGRFGQRGNFEEPYSSDSYRGSFVAGITFLDKTRVGWWKNGFPHFYTRIPNAADWSRVSLRLIDEELDLAQWDVNSFSRRLDMKGVSPTGTSKSHLPKDTKYGYMWSISTIWLTPIYV